MVHPRMGSDLDRRLGSLGLQSRDFLQGAMGPHHACQRIAVGDGDGGKAKFGDKIVYPGPADGGASPADLVASLAFVHPFDTSGAFVNRVDAALAEIAAARLSDVNLAIAKAVNPLGTVLPKRDMKVVKIGRTTGQTTGKVIDVNFRFALTYPGVGKVAYIDQVLCSRYTDGGDSGSIVVDSGSGKIVGLHFAGGPAQAYPSAAWRRP